MFEEHGFGLVETLMLLAIFCVIVGLVAIGAENQGIMANEQSSEHGEQVVRPTTETWHTLGVTATLSESFDAEAPQGTATAPIEIR